MTYTLKPRNGEFMKIIHGNLLESDTVIAHGCNSLGIMGGGIAAQIARKWPIVQEANKVAVDACQFVPGTAQYVRANLAQVVFNLATQDLPGAHARYEWVDLAFRNMAEQCVDRGIRSVSIPQIGCGIGGLSWPSVANVIEVALQNVRARGEQLEVVLYLFDPSAK